MPDDVHGIGSSRSPGEPRVVAVLPVCVSPIPRLLDARVALVDLWMKADRSGHPIVFVGRIVRELKAAGIRPCPGCSPSGVIGERAGNWNLEEHDGKECAEETYQQAHTQPAARERARRTAQLDGTHWIAHQPLCRENVGRTTQGSGVRGRRASFSSTRNHGRPRIPCSRLLGRSRARVEGRTRPRAETRIRPALRGPPSTQEAGLTFFVPHQLAFVPPGNAQPQRARGRGCEGERRAQSYPAYSVQLRLINASLKSQSPPDGVSSTQNVYPPA